MKLQKKIDRRHEKPTKPDHLKKRYYNFTVDFSTFNKMQKLTNDKSKFMNAVLKRMPEAWIDSFMKNGDNFLDQLSPEHFKVVK